MVSAPSGPAALGSDSVTVWPLFICLTEGEAAKVLVGYSGGLSEPPGVTVHQEPFSDVERNSRTIQRTKIVMIFFKTKLESLLGGENVLGPASLSI